MRKWFLRLVKYLLLLFVATVCGVLLWELYFAYGESPKPLNPDTFVEWKTTKILTPQPYVWIVAANPDAASTIRAVAMAIKPENMKLVGYKYFENGEPRSFSIDLEKEKYIETKLTSEQRTRCLECHKYEQRVRKVSFGDAG